MKARIAGLFCNFVCWAQARSRLQLHIAQASVFHLIELVLDFFAGGLGAEAHHHDGHKAQDEAGHQFVNLEDFGAEAREVELPHEGGDAAHQHARDGARKRGSLPEQGKEHNRAEGGAETAPGKTHEAHHDIQEALALCSAVGAGRPLHGDDDCDNRNEHHDAAAHPHDFLVARILAEQVLVEVVTEGRSRNQQLRVGGTHDGGKDSCHEDSGDSRVAERLAENHEDAFRVGDGNAVRFYVVASEDGNHDGGTEADGDPGHGDAAGELDVFGVLDAHETHQNVRHAKIAEAPGEARNQGDKPDGLAGGGVGEQAQQVGVLCVHGVHGRCKSARAGHDNRRNRDDGNQHHGRLDKVRPANGKETAHEGVAHHDDRTDDKAGGVVHAEDGAEEFCASYKARNRVEQEERENEDGGDNADDSLVVAEAVRKEVGQRDGVSAEVAVLAEPAAHDFPVEVGADHETDTDPSFGKPAHEDGAREAHQKPAAHVGGLCGHGHDPLVHAAVAQVVGIQAVRLLGKVKADAKHHQQV